MMRAPQRATQARQACAAGSCALRRTAFGRAACGEEPHRAVKEGGVCVFGAADFFAGHGVAGKKSGLAGAVVFVTGMVTDSALDAADVGDELMVAENGREAVEPFEDGEDGAAEEDEVGFSGGGEGIVGDHGDGFAAERGVELVGIRVPAGDGAGEAVGAQGEADGGSDEAGAEDGDALDGHG